MPADAYTRAVLTVIAASLALLAVHAWIATPALADDMTCHIDGPIRIDSFGQPIEVRIDNQPVQVETQPHSSSNPGSSSVYPLYVKTN
jgi:hypothetical protein